MLKSNLLLRLALILAFGLIIPNSYAKNKPSTKNKKTSPKPVIVLMQKSQPDAVQERADKETMQDTNPFVISLYQPNYLMPFYHTSHPYQSIYAHHTPENQGIQHVDVKFQFSVKIPLIVHMFHRMTNLYIAYSQLSYWQAYNSSPFFRESNYEPAILVSNNLSWKWPAGWQMKFFNLGIMHESNGRGGTLERSWNRVYSEIIFGKGNWMLEFVPWLVLDDQSRRLHNRDIARYLGHGRMILAYTWRRNTFSFETYNNFESGFRRGTMQLSWSFPLSTHIKGYVQYFNGFGQSLIEYNHRTSNSFGVGISISDWI